MLIGYARVSTNEQDTTAQASALKAAGCERIFREKATGGRWNRPELQRLLDHLRKGDVLVVWKLDRLSRSLRDVLTIMERIQEAKAGFRSLTEAIDTTTPAGRMMMQGFRFAPRIRDLADKRLYVPGKERDHPTLVPLIGGKLNLKLVRTQWEEILRLAASIRHGTVTASLIIRKLASYPRQNSLHTALREVGRIERSLFMLEWMKDPELRRRVQVGLNKGEARNALSRAVFFNRQGDMRDRSFENQRYRASGLNLIVAAIVLWNTVYLERAVAALRGHGIAIEDESLAHLSPIGWEHINLTGDYTWQAAGRLRKGAFRPLRPFAASNE